MNPLNSIPAAIVTGVVLAIVVIDTIPGSVPLLLCMGSADHGLPF